MDEYIPLEICEFLFDLNIIKKYIYMRIALYSRKNHDVTGDLEKEKVPHRNSIWFMYI